MAFELLIAGQSRTDLDRLDGSNNIYVLDAGNDRVQKFNPSNGIG